MSDEIQPQAEPIPTIGAPTWVPPIEDDNEAALKHQQAPASGARFIFFGKDGLRAGWSALLFLGLYIAVGLLIALAVKRAHLPSPPHGGEQPASFTLIAEAVNFSLVALLAALVALVERRRFSLYGLGSPAPRLRQFGMGLLWGFVMLSLLVGTLWKLGLLALGPALLSGADVVRWGAVWLLSFLFVGLFEEFLTRGFLQFTVARGVAGIAGSLGMGDRARKVLGFWVAAIFFSFIFGLVHKNNAGESPIGLLSAGLIGLVFAFSLWRTGSLWWAIGLHAAWDWAQSFVYGVADSGQMVQHHLLASHPVGAPLMSGGLTGPEGSIYVLPTTLLIALIVAFTLPSQPGSPSDPAYSPNAGSAD